MNHLENEAEEPLFVLLEETGIRLDKFLASRFPNYSRQYFQYLIEEELVLINGSLAKKSQPLKEGDEVEVEFAATPEISLEPQDIPLDILYEDEDLLAVNKPSGMVVHPAVGNWDQTFVNALLYHCKHLEKGDSLRPGIVHRLDKETSGVIVAAKNIDMQKSLVEAFAGRKIKKEYLAIACGNPKTKRIEANIGRHPTRRKEMAIVEERGKQAITRVEKIAHSEKFSLLRLFPETGRTHQLRVHLKSVGCPILGDSLYGNSAINLKVGAKRQFLHAHSLEFTHPKTKLPLVIKATLPHDMLFFIEKEFRLKYADFDSKS